MDRKSELRGSQLLVREFRKTAEGAGYALVAKGRAPATDKERSFRIAIFRAEGQRYFLIHQSTPTGDDNSSGQFDINISEYSRPELRKLVSERQIALSIPPKKVFASLRPQ